VRDTKNKNRKEHGSETIVNWKLNRIGF